MVSHLGELDCSWKLLERERERERRMENRRGSWKFNYMDRVTGEVAGDRGMN
jgi:hypothetical protein